MITIKIEGPRGSGCTTTAMAIVRLLRGLGQQVTYHTWAKHAARRVEDAIRDEDGPALTEAREFAVIDIGAE